MLLDIYFSDEARRADFTKAALGLLRSHGKAMDPVAVLRRLPATLSVLELKDYLSQVIPHTAHKVRNGQVVRNLYKREQLRINCELVRAWLLRGRDPRVAARWQPGADGCVWG